MSTNDAVAAADDDDDDIYIYDSLTGEK